MRRLVESGRIKHDLSTFMFYNAWVLPKYRIMKKLLSPLCLAGGAKGKKLNLPISKTALGPVED